jgi:hypothetical protein
MSMTTEHPAPTIPPAPPPRDRRWWAVVAAAAAVLVAAIALVVVSDDDQPSTAPTTGTTAPPATPTSGPSSATTATSVTTPPPTVDRSTAIWPFGSGERYTDPVDAAAAFATDYLAFRDPVVGELLQGDARSGEVEIRPSERGPVTTVLVRQLSGEDTWSVLGAVAADIEVTAPEAGAEVRSPVDVAGRALAFEGHVAVEVRQDGDAGPIGAGFVTGGGDELRPFEGTIAFDPPTERYGALVFLSKSAEDGRTWQAAAVRVRLGGGELALGECGGFEPGHPALAAGEMEATVWFTCDPDGAAEPNPIAVRRAVPRTEGVLRASLESLLAGPTQVEREAGITSWFSPATQGLLAGVSITDGRAAVDFAGDLRTMIPNASTSAGSALLLSELDATVLQFRSVDMVEYRLDGSCEAFGEWLQIDGCEVRTRR